MPTPTIILILDKENKQQDYQVSARDMNGVLHVGWLVIEKPWYSSPKDWTYWLFSNSYGAGGFCGGACDLGWKKIIVQADTIRPYNQIEQIKYFLEDDFIVQLYESNTSRENNKPALAIIHNKDEIPYKLWNKKKGK